MNIHINGQNPSALVIDRRAIEDQIEQLIALLDVLDGDADEEDGGDHEHDLGAPEHVCQCAWERSTENGEREDDAEDYEATADEEPWLGWSEGVSQDFADDNTLFSELYYGDYDGTGTRAARAMLRKIGVQS